MPRPVNSIDPSLSALMCFAGSALLVADAVANFTAADHSVQGAVALLFAVVLFLGGLRNISRQI